MLNEIERKLQRPFPPLQLEWKPGRGGKGDFAHLTSRHVQNRLDQVFGLSGWQTNFEFMGGRMICNLSVLIDGNWITKADGAGDTDIEGDKGGISSAFKRAAVHLGIGRYLYHKEAFDRSRTPAKWATPEGFDELMDERALEEGEKSV